MMGIVTRPRKHGYLAWYGFAVERSVHGRIYVFIMWRGRTIWLRRAL